MFFLFCLALNREETKQPAVPNLSHSPSSLFLIPKDFQQPNWNSWISSQTKFLKSKGTKTPELFAFDYKKKLKTFEKKLKT